jgi:hypothetical protein
MMDTDFAVKFADLKAKIQLLLFNFYNLMTRGNLCGASRYFEKFYDVA